MSSIHSTHPNHSARHSDSRTGGPLRALSSAGGAVLAGAARVLGAVRPPKKPLHPRGVVVDGILNRTGSTQSTGVSWLDNAGQDLVKVRVSRALGIPEALPDIFGLAIRVPLAGPGDDGYADVLLATTGLGRLTRFTLTFARSVEGRPLTTLLPYRSPTGPIVIGARSVDHDTFEMLWARPTGPWRTFGRLALAGTQGPDPQISFDPLRHPLPELDNYAWVERLREPAYRAARTQSGRPALP